MNENSLLEPNTYFSRLSCPIVAQATASGGAISVIRVSGSNLEFIKDFFKNKELPRAGSFRYSHFINPVSKKTIDDVLVLNFKSPNSFTGEDVVEINCHGSNNVIQEIISRLIEFGGCKLALPGEFSFRAYCNEKISLQDAELVNLLIKNSGSTIKPEDFFSIRTNSKNKKNDLNKNLQSVHQQLIDLRARVEATIDFSEFEQEQSEEVEAIKFLLNKAIFELSKYLNKFNSLRKTSSISRFLIFGPSNVGKSTLLNILSNTKIAIESDELGTTRDLVKHKIITTHGNKLEIIDSAGIRQDKDINSSSEREGMLNALAELQSNLDGIIFVYNGSKLMDSFTTKLLDDVNALKIPVLKIASHLDMIKVNNSGEYIFDFRKQSDEIKKFLYFKIEEIIKNKEVEIEDFCFNSFAAQNIQSAHSGLLECLSKVDTHSPEILSLIISQSEESIFHSLNSKPDESFLESIFSQFCIGK